MENNLTKEEIHKILSKLFYEDLNWELHLRDTFKQIKDNVSQHGFTKIELKQPIK